MKKIRTLMLTALALIMGAMTAFASPENPTNEEVMTALTRGISQSGEPSGGHCSGPGVPVK